MITLAQPQDEFSAFTASLLQALGCNEDDIVILSEDRKQIVLNVCIGGTTHTVVCILKKQQEITTPSASKLTRREREIVQMIERGLSDKLIARELGISRATVVTYVRRAFEKTNVSNRAELVARVLKDALYNPLH